MAIYYDKLNYVKFNVFCSTTAFDGNKLVSYISEFKRNNYE